MGDSHLFGMQRDATNKRAFGVAKLEVEVGLECREKQRRPAIKFIANEFEANVLQVRSKLVRAGGQGTTFHEHVALEPFTHGKLGSRAFAFLGVDAHQAHLQWVGREFGLGFELRLLWRGNTPNQGGKNLIRFFGGKLRDQVEQCRFVFCKNQNAAGLEVKAVRMHQVTQTALRNPGNTALDAAV